MKVKRVIIKKELGGKVMESVYDRYLNATKKTMFRLIFALAMALKITPKKIASMFSIEDTDEYARAVNEELSKRIKKETEKMRKTIEKASSKV